MERNFYFDQKAFLGASGSAATFIEGLQSFTTDWSSPLTDIKANGYGFITDAEEGFLEGSIGLEKFITSSQNIFAPLFNSTLSGALAYGEQQSYDEVYAFNNAYISSYSTSCEVNSLCSESATLSCFGGLMGVGSTGTTTIPENDIYIAKAGDIVLSIVNPADASDRLDLQDAVQSYDINIDIPRILAPTTMGSNFRQPVESIKVDYPIPVSVTIDILVSSYEAPQFVDLVCNKRERNISVTLNDCGTSIRSFNIGTAKLVSHSTAASVDNNMQMTLSYLRNVTDITDLSSIIQ